MTTLEYPYEECTISQMINYLKTETYPVALTKVRCAYTSNLIRMCLEHNLEDRLTVQQIFEHPFFQPLPTAWPQIRFHSMEREMVTVAICYSETDVKLYSFNVNNDLSGYTAAALVRGEYIKEDQLHDASTQIHKIVEKVKRQTRVKNGIIQDYYSMQTPVTKTPKTPKAVNLTLCSFDADEHKVELELSQTRVGKIVKFQFGVMDNETEEIAQQLILSGHLMTENKENFLQQMNAIVREQRDLAKAQQQDDDEEVKVDDEKADDVSPMEHTDSDVGLNLDIRRKLSRDSMIANPTSVISPDIDSRSQHSESSIQPTSESNYHQPKPMVNGDRDVLPPLPMASPMVPVPRPMPSSMSSSMPSTYQQYPSTPMPPSNIMYYHPQYIPMMPGQPQIHPSQIPQVQPQIPMYPGPHQMMTAPMSYTNGHIQQWPPGMRAPADLNSIRVPTSVAAQLPYSISNDRGSTPRPDIDTPPPPQSFGVPDLVSPDSRSDT